MDIPAIKAFIAVAEQQSFSLAAEKLFITQPAISKRITSLENQLGVKLFDRINRKVILTEAGNIFLPGAKKIIAEVLNSKHALARLGVQVAGDFSLATSHHIGLHHLPPILKKYVNQFPDVDLNLRFMESEDACQAVESTAIELAVITLPNKPSECLASVKIWSDPLSIVVNNTHSLLENHSNAEKENKLAYMHNLSRFPAILPKKGTFTRELIDQRFKQLDLDIQVKFSNNYLETIKMMVSVGLGWSVLPDTLIDKSLSIMKLPGFNTSRSLGVVYHKHRTLSLPAKKLLQLITLKESD